MREYDFVDKAYEGEDFSNLNKLTLIIPTYNRNYYLSRCLWYHAHFPFGQIIVADSSSEEKKVINRETVEKIRSLFYINILYLEYEPENDKYGGDIYRKWSDAVQHVYTEYSIICTDKEFMIPTSLLKCYSFLQNHSDYEFADGCIYNIINSEGQYKLKQRYPHRNPPKFNNPIERFLTSTTRTPAWNNTLLFSLYRTTTMKIVYSNLESYQINDLRYGEIILGYFGHLLGKDNYEKTLCFKFRDEINIDIQRKDTTSSNSQESSTSRYPLMDEYDSDKVAREIAENFIKCIKDNIQVLSNDNPKYLYSTLFETKTWIRYNGQKGKEYAQTWYKSKRIRRIYDNLPHKISNYINKTIFTIFGFALPAQEIIPDESKEISTVLRCIDETQGYQNQDNAVVSQISL